MFRIFFSGLMMCFWCGSGWYSISAAESIHFRVTLDSHYEAVENTECNDRIRVTIGRMNEMLGSLLPEKLGSGAIITLRGPLALGGVNDDGGKQHETVIDRHLWKYLLEQPIRPRSQSFAQFSPATQLELQPVQPELPATENKTHTSVKFAVIGDFGLDNYKPKTNAAKIDVKSLETAPAKSNNKDHKDKDDDDDDDEKLAQSAITTPFQSSQQQRNPFQAAVAKLVKSWQPDFVVTTGDNNYPKGEASTIDDNIGKYYSDFIGNYHGAFGKGAATNRFFPVLGNHDWYATKVGCQAHLDYFTLPGNERYYEFQQGPLHFFMLDNDSHEPDGVKTGTKQYRWFEKAITASKAQFQIVVAHHPPFSSGEHGDNATAQWDYAKHGVDLLLAGHDHNYERIERAGLTYIVNGAGGANLRRFKKVVEGSLVRYNAKHGAMLMETEQTGDAWLLHGRFVNIDGEEVDHFTLKKPLKQ